MNALNEDWILKQFRAAVFYVTECRSALWEIERLIQSEGGDPWDVVDTFFEMRSMYPGRNLFAGDLTLFFDGLHELQRMERRFQSSLQKSVRAKLLEQLRKANWTYDKTARISEIIAQRFKLSPQVVEKRIHVLAPSAPDGRQLTTEDVVDIFLLGSNRFAKSGSA
jgi:hypothetical protein